MADSDPLCHGIQRLGAAGDQHEVGPGLRELVGEDGSDPERASGVSPSAVHLHFRSQADLVATVIAAVLRAAPCPGRRR